ncbi:MAG: thioredoxin family protein [Flavobacteriaceae bacterium]
MNVLEDKGLIETSEYLIQEALFKAMSYKEYREKVAQLVAEGKSTGTEQTEPLAQYTLLNDKRMKRLDKTIKVDEASAAKIGQLDKKITWLVLTESWCADAAQSMPVMNKIAEQNANIDFKVILRDDNLEVMNRFLYNGTMSIPKLISIDDETGKVLGEWGPRPSTATEMVNTYKKLHGKLTSEFKQDLQLWYNKDKGISTLEGLTGLLLK